MVNLKLHLYFPGWEWGGGWGWVVIIKYKAKISSTGTGLANWNWAWQKRPFFLPKANCDGQYIKYYVKTWKFFNFFQLYNSKFSIHSLIALDTVQAQKYKFYHIYFYTFNGYFWWHKTWQALIQKYWKHAWTIQIWTLRSPIIIISNHYSYSWIWTKVKPLFILIWKNPKNRDTITPLQN